MPADVYNLSVVLPLHNALLSRRGTPVNLFTRGCKQVCKLKHLPPLHRFCPSVCKLCITFARSKFGANPFFRPEFVFHKCQNIWFIFYFISFYLFYLYVFLQRQTITLPYIKVPNIHLIHERRLLLASVVFAANLI